MIKQLSVFLENNPGRLAELTRTLGDAGINMRALMVADTAEYGVVRILCDTPDKAVSVLEGSGFGVSVSEVIAVEVPDRPGGLADVLEALGSEGINVEYAYCFVEPSGTAAVDIFRVDDPAKAQTTLKMIGVRVAGAADLYSIDVPSI
ncbi:MAG: ACT domain-containing protein [Coriobacteriia bacterium]|nr:ACT domain-containing protein [Coriobacteriia bacterium]